MNNPSTSKNLHLEEIDALRQHLLELKQSNRQYQQEVEQLTKQLSDEKAARQQVEERLNVATERFQLAAKAVNCVIYDWDLVEDRIERTDGLTRLLGYSLEETKPTGQWWCDRIHPDDLHSMLNQALATLTEDDYFTAEYRILNKSNQYINVLDRGLVVARDANGKPKRIVGSTADISEQKRAESQLQESQRFIQQIAHSLPGTLYVYDILEQRNVYINRQVGELVGYTPEQIQIFGDRLFPELMHPEDLANLGTEIERLNQAKFDEVIDREYRLRHANGEWRWFWSRNMVSTRTPDGRPHQVIGTVYDITDRKRAEEALQQSEERYRSLAELIPQLVWTANTEGMLMDVNQRWSTFTGLTLAQAQIQGWEAIIHPDDVPILGQNWAIAQQNGTYYQAEGRMRRADGVYRWHLHQAVALKNDRGQVMKWFGTATDIEDHKQLEQQRIHLLQQEQVAREQAETANRIKDEFLAVLSHELRTPLNPILGWTKLLRTRKLDSQAADRALDTIERNAKLQAQLIEDLLDVSRILQGKVSLNICPVNLVTTIEAAIETVRLSAQAKGIQIQTQLDSEVGQVNGDANRLQQIVWNLLSNAIKFTSSGGCVKVRLDKTGIYAKIQVSDTGNGISADFLPYVFEYFRQADSSTTRQFGGLGLGLAIVHHLVELHGGTVKVESPGYGMGATFTVQLPLMRSVRTPNVDILPTQETDNLNGICILIVDDEADMRDLARFILEQQGATVMVAASAAEALQHFAESVPDVLISDIGMPEMDGYALIQQIRRTLSECRKTIPAIALTAYAGDINQRKAVEAGFQIHLAKPIEPQQLVKTVAQLVARSSKPL